MGYLFSDKGFLRAPPTEAERRAGEYDSDNSLGDYEITSNAVTT